MTVIEQHEHHFDAVTWHVVEEFNHFEILRKRLPVKALHIKSEPQYRIRTKKGKSRFILYQSGALGEVYAYLSCLEKAVGEAETTQWGLEAWDKLVNSVPQSELSNGEKMFMAHPVRRESNLRDTKIRPSILHKENIDRGSMTPRSTPVSPLHSPTGSPFSDSPRGSSSGQGGVLVGQFLRAMELQAAEITTLMDWSNSGVTIACIVVIVLSWFRGVAFELLGASALWWLAAVVDKARAVQEVDGDYALERALEWGDRQVACLLQPARIPLVWRLLTVPTVAFVLFQIFNPPGFRLFVLLLPFLASTTRAFCPMFLFLFHPKSWLWIPYSDALPPSAIPKAHEGRVSTGPRSPLRTSSSAPLPRTPHSDRDSSASSQASSGSDTERHHPPPAAPAALVSVSVKIPSLPRAVVKMMDLHLGEGWQLYRRDGDMVVDSKPVPWCETPAFRLTTVFNCSLEAFGQFMSLTENVFKTDQLIEKRVAIEDIDQHTTVYHSTYKSPMIGVSKRDALLEMTRMYFTAEEAQGLGLPAKRSFVEAAFSCDHPACPPAKAYIRTKVFCAGYLAQEEGPHRITLVNVGSASPEGWIPSKVVEAVGSKLTVKIEKLRHCIEASASNAVA